MLALKPTHTKIVGWCVLYGCCFAIACAAAACGDVEPTQDTAQESQNTVRQQALDAVFAENSGHWSTVLGCSGFCVSRYHFWVDIAVRNDAFYKEVGVLWTDNGWASINTAFAQYEGTREDGYETWGLDTELGTGLTRPDEIEYAVFAKMNGQTFWDPRNNYYIYNKVSVDKPVLRLTSEVHYEAGIGGVMTGTARVFDLSFDKRVWARYTTDDWATWDEVEATWIAQNDWSFRVEGLGLDTLPEKVQYAVRYDVGTPAETWWDNNNGDNYQHTMSPAITPGFEAGEDAPYSGWITLYGNVRTDMPSTATRTRIDGGPWSDGLTTTFSTQDLDDGAHTIEFQVELDGGYTATSSTTFHVANTLLPGETWSPTLDDVPLGTAWDLTRDAEGRMYVVWDGPGQDQIVRYPAFGDNSDPVVFEQAGWGLQHISVDEEGRVYAALTRDPFRLARWSADGTLDSTFGTDGIVEIDGPLGGTPICYAGATTLGQDTLYLLDTCNARVLRFDRDGQWTGAVDMTSDRYIPSALMVRDGTLWIMQAESLTQIEDNPAQPMAIESVTEFSDGYRFNSARGLTQTNDGVFWSNNSIGQLVAFQADGTILGLWSGGRDDRAADGAFHLPQNIVIVDGTTVAVLGAAGARIATFRLP